MPLVTEPSNFTVWWRVQKWTLRMYISIKLIKWGVRLGGDELSPDTLSAMCGVAHMIKNDIIERQRQWNID
jgi:hypothetical protein